MHLRAGRTREAIEALKISLWSEETAEAHEALGEAYLLEKNTRGRARRGRARPGAETGYPEAMRLLKQAAPVQPVLRSAVAPSVVGQGFSLPDRANGVTLSSGPWSMTYE